MRRAPVLTFTKNGIYCPAGNFYIDPWRPVERALITHGHADHARSGHRRYLATDLAGPVMQHRLGKIDLDAVKYGQTRQIGDATVSFHPAGHVPGSAQIKVEVSGEIWVVSGDYKTENDGLSDPFEPVACHSFITECTFGMPVFDWQPQAAVMAQINDWWANNAAEGRTSVLGAYALGKAQRLLVHLNPDIGPILSHTAIAKTNDILDRQSILTNNSIQVTANLDVKKLPGALVLAPPSALGSAWLRRFGPVSEAVVSGWMRLRGVRRRRNAERGFVLSDHADWKGLLQAVRATGAENIYTTHGYTDVFSRYLNEIGYHAQTVKTEFTGETLEQDQAP